MRTLTNPTTQPVGLWTPTEAAQYLGKTERWLRRRRELELAPSYIRIGQSVMYDPADVRAFAMTQKVVLDA